MKINFKTLIVSVLIPLAVGVVSGLLSMSGIRAFGDLNMPPLSPPAFLFPIVWTILYILMGIDICCFLVFVSYCKSQVCIRYLISHVRHIAVP